MQWIWYLKFSSLPETCIFIIWTSRKSFIRLGHATDQKRHLGLICLRIFKMHWVSVPNDHLGHKSLIRQCNLKESVTSPTSASGLTRMTTSDKFQRHSFKVAFEFTAKSVRSHILTFGIFENRIAGWGSYEDLIIGAGAAGAGTFCPEPESPYSFTRSRSRSRSRSQNASPEPEPTKNVTASHPCC